MKVVFIFIGLIVSLACFSQDNLEFKHFNLEDGLSHTHVLSIDQDTMGYLWIGTFNGVNKFDGYKFTTYVHDPKDSTSVPTNIFHDIHVDQQGTVWCATEYGFCSYNRYTDNFKNYEIQPPKNIIDEYKHIRSIISDNHGNLWVGTYRNGLLKYNIEDGTCDWFQHDSADANSINSNRINNLYFDSDDDLWICHEDGKLSYFNISENKFNVFPSCTEIKGEFLFAHDIANKSLNCVNDDVFTSVHEDENGNFWTSTWRSGFIKHDKYGNQFQYFFPKNESADNSYYLTIRDLIGYNNKLYAAIFGGGLAVFNKSNNKFEKVFQNTEEATSLSQNMAWKLFVDDESNLWVGTFEGGLNMTPLKKQESLVFKGFKNNEVRIENVISIIEDNNQNVWVGTQQSGIFKINYGAKTIDNIYIDSLPVAINTINSITQDKDNRFWFGTNLGTLKYNPKNNKFTHYSKAINPDFATDVITSIASDKDGNIWIGTYSRGVIKMPYAETYKDVKDAKIKNYRYNVNDSTSIASDFIEVLHKDLNNDIWVGTKGFISKYIVKSDGFLRIPEDGAYVFQNDSKGNVWFDTYTGSVSEIKAGSNKVIPHFLNPPVLSIEEFKEKLWFTTETDIYVYDIVADEIYNLTERNLFPNFHFRPNASAKLKNNTLVFGSSEGLIQVYPERISLDSKIREVYIKNIFANNRVVKIGEKIKNTVILDKAPDVEDYIEIPPVVRSLSIEFRSIRLNNSNLEEYVYMLEGFDTTWIHANDLNNKATYTNLDGGKYVFKVANATGRTNWHEGYKSLNIKVIPPYYKTLWFRLVFILFVIAIVSITWIIRMANIRKANIYLEEQVNLRTNELRKTINQLAKKTDQLNETNTLLEERQQQIEEQSEELRTQRDTLHEANSVKDRLFGIIAHDLKNPFSNLMGFASLLKNKFDVYPVEKTKAMIDAINDSSEKIYSLLIGLLDWSRAQQGAISFKPVNCYISELITETSKIFETQALKKNINIKLILDENIHLNLDVNLINAVLRNLISNAIKFTNANGTISVSCEKDDTHVIVRVKDNGVGMPKDIAEKIFNKGSHHTTYGTNGEKGTGLGLQTVKDFIKMHQGQIWVESEEGKGSTFSIKLPLSGSPA